MTQEKKAKAYEEAIKIAKEELKEADAIEYNLPDSAHAIRTTVYSLFPDLKESESQDERIRKALKEYFINSFQNNGVAAICGVHIKDILAWLEKQGEQKPILDVEIPFGAKDSELQEASYNIPNGYHAEIEDNKVVIKQGEQKPAWSKEDERICCTIVNDIEIDKTRCKYEISKGICDEQINWLKSLKDRVQPQPKQEWSLKEDAFIQVCVNAINDISYFRSEDKEELINWLNSLKPQSHWKPSEEQMNTLEYYMHTLACNEHKEILFGLYADLKKLRE